MGKMRLARPSASTSIMCVCNRNQTKPIFSPSPSNEQPYPVATIGYGAIKSKPNQN